jgi:hypothetical protein
MLEWAPQPSTLTLAKATLRSWLIAAIGMAR